MDPVYIANENTVENCTLKFLKLLEQMVYLNRITSKVGQDVTEQFMKMISEVVPKCKDKFLEFINMNTVWTHFFQGFYLRNVMNHCGRFFSIFCLFHGQVVIELGFKRSDDCSVINQSKESLIAL